MAESARRPSAASPAAPPAARTLADRALLRGSDDLLVDFDRGFKMFQEFVAGCRALHDIGPAVTVFGSARFDETHRYYKLARELGAALARKRYAVITGGGPGIMEAANRGAHDVQAVSAGFNITLPMEQEPNPYMSPELCFQFHYFAMRKMHFLMRAVALMLLASGASLIVRALA